MVLHTCTAHNKLKSNDLTFKKTKKKKLTAKPLALGTLVAIAIAGMTITALRRKDPKLQPYINSPKAVLGAETMAIAPYLPVSSDIAIPSIGEYTTHNIEKYKIGASVKDLGPTQLSGIIFKITPSVPGNKTGRGVLQITSPEMFASHAPTAPRALTHSNAPAQPRPSTKAIACSSSLQKVAGPAAAP